ncbi:DUF721 domain-containing protein [Streptomyces sp. NBC_00847]|uniref:DUF721 domain-containing protein n=1 Tax=Streptomyces sp. NBC_00847 TaxID=2975850 RepID=UPI00225E300E|nr:DUF721 domain-containing protein [Streptomyces sp. NBC_00847]MCX4885951.1 DUF721 domain-containing protein [Streptomyces sp. NBC_00847]
MTDAPASGADLARQALARARAAAKTSPTPQTRRPKRVRREMGSGRDPRPIGHIVDGLAATEGWADSLGAGNLTDRWTELCPTVYADTTQPVGYDPDTGTLTLQTASHTVATGLRMAEPMLVQSINGKLGRAVVRQIRVRIGSDGPGPRSLEDTMPAAPADPEAPIRTREDGCPGYQDARAIVLEHRPEPPPTDPYVEEAMRRQETALRAGRQPETEHREAVWAEADTAPVPAAGSVEESLARARAYARQQRDGRAPRRAFDPA